MNHPPPKRRWQFSLKVMFVVITMFGVGMGLMHLGYKLNENVWIFSVRWVVIELIGWMLISASPGVLIGYGYHQLQGAILGGMASCAIIFFLTVLITAFFSG